MGLFSRLFKVSKAAIKSKAQDLLEDGDESDESANEWAGEITQNREPAKLRGRKRGEKESSTRAHIEEKSLNSPSPVLGEDVHITERDGSKRSL